MKTKAPTSLKPDSVNDIPVALWISKTRGKKIE